jgi:hypothetical protein
MAGKPPFRAGLLLLLGKLLQFADKLSESFIDGQLAVDSGDQEIADGAKTRAAHPKDWNTGLEDDIFCRALAILIIRRQFLVGRAFLNG